jgi:hypothetical protein
MDGTGISGVTLDLSKAQIFLIDFQWLGIGRVRIGFDIDGAVIYVHEYKHANRETDVYMRTPSLPLRFEIGNTDITASSTTMQEICSSISSEGGFELPGLESAVSTEIIPRTVSTTKEPVLAIRLKNEFPAGKPNRRVVKFLEMSFMVATNDAHIELLHVHAPIDITATWQELENGIEFSTDISAFTGRPSHEIVQDFGPTTQAGKSNARAITGEFISLHGSISQSIDSDNSQMFVIVAQSFTGNSDISAALSVLEIL